MKTGLLLLARAAIAALKQANRSHLPVLQVMLLNVKKSPGFASVHFFPIIPAVLAFCTR